MTDHLMGFDIHVLAHRTGIGAALALIAGGDIRSGFPFYPGQEMIAPAGQERSGFLRPLVNRGLGFVGWVGSIHLD